MNLFKRLDIRSYLKNLLAIFSNQVYYGWGLKRSGRFAKWCQQRFGGRVVLQEDGFIRSIGLGVEGAKSMSVVHDDVGIYYDATSASKLENLLNSYDYQADPALIGQAREAIALIVNHNISKYNHAPFIDKHYFKDDGNRVLIIAQTKGDMALKYGMSEHFSTQQMIDDAKKQNPDASVYIKIHPDVLSGKKQSDIAIDVNQPNVFFITEDINPISLLQQFKRVYTKTSQMGFEALLCGCECICYGMPFYAGWGITTDKVSCARRQKKHTIEEVFAAAYIQYTNYYHPTTSIEQTVYETIKIIINHQKITND